MCEREKNRMITSVKGILNCPIILVFAEARIFGGLFASEEMI